jgi:hypothetical protein
LQALGAELEFEGGIVLDRGGGDQAVFYLRGAEGGVVFGGGH